MCKSTSDLNCQLFLLEAHRNVCLGFILTARHWPKAWSDVNNDRNSSLWVNHFDLTFGAKFFCDYDSDLSQTPEVSDYFYSSWHRCQFSSPSDDCQWGSQRPAEFYPLLKSILAIICRISISKKQHLDMCSLFVFLCHRSHSSCCCPLCVSCSTWRAPSCPARTLSWSTLWRSVSWWDPLDFNQSKVWTHLLIELNEKVCPNFDWYCMYIFLNRM